MIGVPEAGLVQNPDHSVLAISLKDERPTIFAGTLPGFTAVNGNKTKTQVYTLGPTGINNYSIADPQLRKEISLPLLKPDMDIIASPSTLYISTGSTLVFADRESRIVTGQIVPAYGKRILGIAVLGNWR